MSNTAQRSFAHGELSPSLYPRADLDAYRRGLRTLLNAYAMRTGGAESRPGTVYKGDTKGYAAARLVPCVFDDDQNYMLEFGEMYVRFWKNGVLLTVSGIAAWVTATVYAAGIVRSNGGTNYVSLVAHTSAGTSEPGVGATWQDFWYSLGAGSTVTYELPTDYAASIRRELQFVPTLGVLRISHNTVPLQKLVRVAETQWYFAEIESAPTLASPQNMATDAPTPGDVAAWCVTAYDSANEIESLASSPVSSDTAPNSPGSIFTETWDAVTGATSYRVYRSDNLSVFGLLYETTALSYIDTGARSPDLTVNPPTQLSDFSSAGTYPGVIGGYQQRVFHSGSVNEPDFVRGSKVAAPDDFTVSTPLVDSDAVSFRMIGSRVIRPRHFLEVARTLMMFTNVGEVAVEGDDTGIITPSGINPRFISHNGSAKYPSPLPVNASALYVQAHGGIVRDLLPGQLGSDLTVNSAHLVEGHTILEWCYQQTPQSIIWAVRDDGVLLSLTYQRETGMLAWARHTFDEAVESVCCVPETGEDAVYLVVRHTISGTKRFVDRFANRVTAWPNTVCMDASETFAYSRPHSTLTLSSGIYGGGQLTITGTGSGGSGSFTTADIGRTGCVQKAGVNYRFTISAFTSATVVTLVFVIADGILADSDAFTTLFWWYTSVVGAPHLTGEQVSVVLDGVVDASPYNPAYTSVTVIDTTDGIVNFNQMTPFAVATVGLPFVMDMETLDLETAGGRSLKEGRSKITQVGVWLEDSFSFHASQVAPSSATAVTDMQENPPVDEDGNASAVPVSGYRVVNVDGVWNRGGRVSLRHVDPTPLTVLAIIPIGDFAR